MSVLNTLTLFIFSSGSKTAAVISTGLDSLCIHVLGVIY